MINDLTHLARHPALAQLRWIIQVLILRVWVEFVEQHPEKVLRVYLRGSRNGTLNQPYFNRNLTVKLLHRSITLYVSLIFSTVHFGSTFGWTFSATRKAPFVSSVKVGWYNSKLRGLTCKGHFHEYSLEARTSLSNPWSQQLDPALLWETSEWLTRAAK